MSTKYLPVYRGSKFWNHCVTSKKEPAHFHLTGVLYKHIHENCTVCHSNGFIVSKTLHCSVNFCLFFFLWFLSIKLYSCNSYISSVSFVYDAYQQVQIFETECLPVECSEQKLDDVLQRLLLNSRSFVSTKSFFSRFMSLFLWLKNGMLLLPCNHVAVNRLLFQKLRKHKSEIFWSIFWLKL
jgi:hypothetical protein